MAKRSTVEVQTIKDNANKFFRDSHDSVRDGRMAVQMFVADILMTTGNYKGFGYLTESVSVKGNSIGIIFDESSARKHVYPDDSRIMFY